MAEEEVRLGLSTDDDVSAALDRIARRLDEVERKLDEVAVAGKVAGKSIDDAMDDAEDAVKGAGSAADEATPKIRKMGDEADKTAAKSSTLAKAVDKLGRNSRKTGRNLLGLGSILNAFKIATVITGVVALAGGLSALGAGAAIAVGGLAPVVGILGVLPALFLAVKLSTLAFKLAATQLEQPLTRMKSQFTDLGPIIAGGGLASGLDVFANSLRGLARATGVGLRGIGAEIGLAAREAGALVSSRRFLDQVATIFEGMRPIVAALSRALIQFASGFLNLLQASMPVAQDVAKSILDISTAFNVWTARVLESGAATRFMFKAWDLFRQVIGVLVDVLIGTFNVLRIGARYADEMGHAVWQAAWNFRLWTESAAGQARINQYFVDSLPALREMGRLLAMVVGGLVSLGTNQNIAPLLAQIREQLAPAIGALVTNLTGQAGLGPALITTAANFVQLLAGLDFSGLTMFVQAVGQFLGFVLMLTQTVPGANFLVSALLMSFLGFKVLAPVFSLVKTGATAFGWVAGALRGVEGLSKAQLFLKAAVYQLWVVFKMVGAGIVTVVRLIGAAFMANPVIAIIAIIIGLIVLLWFKCEWFRNAVTAAWEWIAKAAGVAWDWIVNAVGVAVSWIVDKAMWLWNNGLKPAWEIISAGVRMYIMIWVTIIRTVVEVIATVVTWLWENVIKPVWNAISAAAEVAWNVISFIVQTVVFFIALQIAIIAKVAEVVWNAVATAGRWVWETILAPIIGWFVGIFTTAVGWLQEKWAYLVAFLSAAWQGWVTILTTAFAWIKEKWDYYTTLLGIAWQMFYSTYIQPVIDTIKAAWDILTGALQVAWQAVAGWIGDRWNDLSMLVGNVVETIKTIWSSGVSWLKDFFQPVSDTIGKIWEGIGSAASKAAEVVRGAWSKAVDMVKGAWNVIATGWNSIPSVTVPDWVPGMGGQTFSLPKLPMLYAGGPTPGGPALVGEHGPEPLVRGGQVVGMLGMNGPEVANLPRGGYVVPNLSTLSALPGLARSIPPSVAAAVAASVPGYRPAVQDNGLRYAVEELTSAIRSMPPAITVPGGGDTRREVLSALREFRREEETRKRHSYQAGRG